MRAPVLSVPLGRLASARCEDAGKGSVVRLVGASASGRPDGCFRGSAPFTLVSQRHAQQVELPQALPEGGVRCECECT